MLCREGTQWRRYRIPRHLARPYVSALAEEADGTVWAGSVSEGLFCFGGQVGGHQRQQRALGQPGGVPAGGSRRQPLGGHGRGVATGCGESSFAGVRATKVWATGPCRGWRKWRRESSGRASPARAFTSGRAELSPVAAAGLPGAPGRDLVAAARDGGCWMSGREGLWRVPRPEARRGGEVAGLAGQNVISLARTGRAGCGRARARARCGDSGRGTGWR